MVFEKRLMPNRAPRTDEKREELERICAWLVEAWCASPRCGLCNDDWDEHDDAKCPAEALALKLVELEALRASEDDSAQPSP